MYDFEKDKFPSPPEMTIVIALITLVGMATFRLIEKATGKVRDAPLIEKMFNPPDPLDMGVPEPTDEPVQPAPDEPSSTMFAIEPRTIGAHLVSSRATARHRHSRHPPARPPP